MLKGLISWEMHAPHELHAQRNKLILNLILNLGLNFEITKPASNEKDAGTEDLSKASTYAPVRSTEKTIC